MAEKKESSNKWWEFYFVRYFVGTVVGGTILVYLNSAPGALKQFLPGVGDASSLDATKFSLLAALGLTYCYVASAPVLVFHGTRGAVAGRFKGLFFLVLAILLIGGAALAGWMSHAGSGDMAFVALFAVLLVAQGLLILLSVARQGQRTHVFYEKLIAARSAETEYSRQYVESYRHLREHGNAFFILVFEFVLALFLVHAPSREFALLAVFLWIAPAALVWSVGTILEERFSNGAPAGATRTGP